jgi:hypothetical protein
VRSSNPTKSSEKPSCSDSDGGDIATASQMDKASIIKDAIEYIEQLQAEERRALQALEAGEGARCGGHGHGEEARVVLQQPAAAPAPVEVLELRVSEVGDRVLVVNVTCSKGRDAMARVCRAVEELRLRVITASVTSVAGCLMHTIFVEVRRRQASTSSSIYVRIVHCLRSKHRVLCFFLSSFRMLRNLGDVGFDRIV